jgi:CheY-like chemotaxis protein
MTGRTIPLRILVLDDDPMIRRALERVAEARVDVALEAVGTPAELRTRVDETKTPYDLIACDYMLKEIGPGATSAELVRDLHRLRLPVAVMTGDVRSAVTNLGFTVPTISKPLLLDDLIAEAIRLKSV